LLSEKWFSKEELKRNIANRLQTNWNLKPAYPRLKGLPVSILRDLRNALEFEETEHDFNTTKSKSGYAIQIIKTYRSLYILKIEDETSE